MKKYTVRAALPLGAVAGVLAFFHVPLAHAESRSVSGPVSVKEVGISPTYAPGVFDSFSINSRGEVAMFRPGLVSYIGNDGVVVPIAPSEDFPNVVPSQEGNGRSQIKITDNRIIFFTGYRQGENYVRRLFAINLITNQLHETVIDGLPQDFPGALPGDRGPIVRFRAAHNGTVVVGRIYEAEEGAPHLSQLLKFHFDGSSFSGGQVLGTQPRVSLFDFDIDRSGTVYYRTSPISGISMGDIYNEGGGLIYRDRDDEIPEDEDGLCNYPQIYEWRAAGGPDELFVRCNFLQFPGPGGIFRFTGSSTMSPSTLLGSAQVYFPHATYTVVPNGDNLVYDHGLSGPSLAILNAGQGDAPDSQGTYAGPNPETAAIVTRGRQVALDGDIENTHLVTEVSTFAVSSSGYTFGRMRVLGRSTPIWFVSDNCLFFEKYCSSVHIGQVVENPDFNKDKVVDIVNGKSGYAILRITKNGLPVSGLAINSLHSQYDVIEGDTFSNVTDEAGQVYIKYVPFVATARTLDSPVPLRISFSDPNEGAGPKTDSRKINILNTQNINLGYSAITRSIVLDRYAPFAGNFQIEIARSHLFTRTVFPLADDSSEEPIILPTFRGSLFSVDGMDFDREDLLNLIGDKEVEKGIVLHHTALFVPEANSGLPSYLNFHERNAVGVGSDDDVMVFAQEGRWTTSAHEISHNRCVRYDEGYEQQCKEISAGSDHNNSITANVSGYNVIESEHLPSPPRLANKYPYFNGAAIPNSADYYTLQHQWSDKVNYEQLFLTLVEQNRRKSLEVEEGLRVGIEVLESGMLSLKYAVPNRIDSVPNLSANSMVLLKGYSSSGEIAFSIYAKDLSHSRNRGFPRPRDSERRFYEAVIPYSYSVSRVVAESVLPGGRAETVFVPAIEAIRSQLKRIPDEAFVRNASVGRNVLNTELDKAASFLLAGSSEEGVTSLAKFGLIVKEEISPSYTPQDATELRRVELEAVTSESILHIPAIGAPGNIKKNGIISITRIDNSPSPGKVSYIGQRLTRPLNVRQELALRGSSNGTPISLSFRSDGSFKVVRSQGESLSVSSMLRDKRRAEQYLTSLRGANQRAATVKSALDVTDDPALREILEAELAKLYAQARIFSDSLKALERPIGEQIDF